MMFPTAHCARFKLRNELDLQELNLWRRKIDTVTRRLVRHEANVGTCDRVVACLESEIAASPDVPAAPAAPAAVVSG